MSVEKIIQIERSHRRVLFGALSVIGVFGLYRWILAPHTEQLLAAQRYERSLDETIRKADFMVSAQDSKKAKIEQLAKECEQSRNQLFKPMEARQFFASIPSVAGQAGCVIQTVSTSPDSQQNTQNDSPIVAVRKAAVTFIGGYNDVIKFLAALQNYEKKVWIESVRMEAGGAGKLKCQMSLTIYCIERLENN
jgi:Tfp pilus assembly protein PilO